MADNSPRNADNQSREDNTFARNNGMEIGTDDNSFKVDNTGNISVRVDLDASNAITGLKAVQREARESTKALRELMDESKKAGVNIDGHFLLDDDEVSDD